VANVGVHCHSHQVFKESLKDLLGWMSELPSTVLPFFRASSPGHKGCKPRGRWTKYDWSKGTQVFPLENYTEWKKTDNGMHDWNLIEDYNQFAQDYIADHHRDIHYINIFNSTVLRRDGHMGGNDCLHYWTPGPVDWWAHFLYSTLIDLATIAGEQGPRQLVNESYSE
jgi:hypothetical protein